jgi:2'-5' RNA ligase
VSEPPTTPPPDEPGADTGAPGPTEVSAPAEPPEAPEATGASAPTEAAAPEAIGAPEITAPEEAPAPVPAAPAEERAEESARPGAQTHVRSFLAINLPVQVVRRIVDEAAGLKPAVAAAGLKVRWVPAANVHLTLRFLGSVKVDAIEAIRDRLARDLPSHGSFELEVRGLGASPRPAHPRVLWAGVVASAPLAALQQQMEGWLEELGFPREERPFHPHLTVGRVTGGAGSLEAALAERADRVLGGGRVTEVVIYESRTLRGGAEYRPLARIPLGRRPAPQNEQSQNRER